jgi:mRNA-degrading endonuclease RelE of RelBE toxin-antitoxin system
MSPVFSVQVTTRFDRDYRKLLRVHPDIAEQYARVVSILSDDPYNQRGSHPIKKLGGVKPGDGQYRIKFLRYRFIYDIDRQTVWLKLCRLRNEGTYKLS